MGVGRVRKVFQSDRTQQIDPAVQFAVCTVAHVDPLGVPRTSKPRIAMSFVHSKHVDRQDGQNPIGGRPTHVTW